MRRGIAVFISVALVGLASPSIADDEIEMEPDPKPVPKKDPPKDPPRVEPKKEEPKGDPAAVVKDPKLAKKLVFTAQQAVLKADYFARIKKDDEAKKEYEAALVAFQKAVELGDDPNVYFELATVEEKLGKLADAATHWRVVIKATAGVRPDVLKKATVRYEETIAKVGLLTLVVKPDGTAISLAGVEVGKSPMALPLILMPGTYKLSFAADGHQLKDLEVKVEAGSESERGIDLEPIKVAIETSKPVVEDKPDVVAAKPSKIPLYAGVGATGGFFVVGMVTGVLALSKHGTFVGVDTPNGQRQDARESGRTLARVTDAMLVGTLVAGGFTAYWWYFKYRPAQRKLKEAPPTVPTRRGDDPLGAKVSVVPWVQSDAGGVSFGGRF